MDRSHAPLVAGGDSQRLGQTPCVVKGAIGPGECLDLRTGRRYGLALQSDVFQGLFADSLAFGAKLLRNIFDCLEDGWIGCRRGVFRDVKPRSKCPRTRFKASRWLPVADGRRNTAQIVMKLYEMIKCMAKPDEAGLEYPQIGGFQRKRLQEVVDLPDRFDRRVVTEGVAGEAAAYGVDRTMSKLQGRPPAGLERDCPSRFGEDRIETADGRLAALSGDSDNQPREAIKPRVEGGNSHKLEDAAEGSQSQHAVVIVESRTDPAGGCRHRAK